MRLNQLRYQNPVEVTFDDLIETPAGKLDFHPDLTTAISLMQWRDLYEAMAFALLQGMVMNVHLTIAWRNLGIRDHNEAREKLERFFGALRKRAEVRGWPCAYIYAHENASNRGFHTHVLTIWPHADKHNFKAWFYSYFSNDSRFTEYDPQAVFVEHRKKDVSRHWLWFGYLTKSAHPGYTVGWRRPNGIMARGLGDLMLKSYRPGGRVFCRKRVGVSRNLDRAARLQYSDGLTQGFSSRLSRGTFVDKGEIYTDEYIHEGNAARSFAGPIRI